MADLKLGNILPVGADNVVVEGKYVKGGYVVVATLAERDSLKGSDGQNIVNGSLCYCQEDSKFYQYNGQEWIEAEFGSDLPIDDRGTLIIPAGIASESCTAYAKAGTAIGVETRSGSKGFTIWNIGSDNIIDSETGTYLVDGITSIDENGNEYSLDIGDEYSCHLCYTDKNGLNNSRQRSFYGKVTDIKDVLSVPKWIYHQLNVRVPFKYIVDDTIVEDSVAILQNYIDEDPYMYCFCGGSYDDANTAILRFGDEVPVDGSIEYLIYDTIIQGDDWERWQLEWKPIPASREVNLWIGSTNDLYLRISSEIFEAANSNQTLNKWIEYTEPFTVAQAMQAGVSEKTSKPTGGITASDYIANPGDGVDVGYKLAPNGAPLYAITVSPFFGIPDKSTFRPFITNSDGSISDSEYLDQSGIDQERNTFRIPSKPLLGNRMLGGYTYATGYACKANTRGAATFGRANIADGNYSGAIGFANKAGYAAFATGNGTSAIGIKSFTQGADTEAYQEAASAMGVRTNVDGFGAHGAGVDVDVDGRAATGFGEFITVNGQAAHAAGSKVNANGKASIAFGSESTAGVRAFEISSTAEIQEESSPYAVDAYVDVDYAGDNTYGALYGIISVEQDGFIHDTGTKYDGKPYLKCYVDLMNEGSINTDIMVDGKLGETNYGWRLESSVVTYGEADGWHIDGITPGLTDRIDGFISLDIVVDAGFYQYHYNEAGDEIISSDLVAGNTKTIHITYEDLLACLPKTKYTIALGSNLKVGDKLKFSLPIRDKMINSDAEVNLKVIDKKTIEGEICYQFKADFSEPTWDPTGYSEDVAIDGDESKVVHVSSNDLSGGPYTGIFWNGAYYDENYGWYSAGEAYGYDSDVPSYEWSSFSYHYWRDLEFYNRIDMRWDMGSDIEGALEYLYEYYGWASSDIKHVEKMIPQMPTGLEVSDTYSIIQQNYDTSYINVGKITEIDGNTLTVDTLPTFKDKKNDNEVAYYLTVLNKPNIGDTCISDTAYAEGYKTTAAATYTHTGGFGSIASATGAFAHGQNAKATSRWALALGGDNPEANGAFSVAIGKGAQTMYSNQIAFGANNDASDKNAMFMVGNGSSRTNRSNAFVIYKDGSAQLNGKRVLNETDLDNIPKYSDATQSTSGLMSSGDKTNLDNLNSRIKIGTGNRSLILNGVAGSGQESFASGEFAKAGGRSTKALGKGATTEGINTIASGTNSFAAGDKSMALGNNSFVIGAGVTHSNFSNITSASDINTTDIIQEWEDGKEYNAAIQANSFVLGRGNIANGQRSIVAGYRNRANNTNQVVFGKYNDYNSEAVFSIGNGTSHDNRSNAFEVFNNGTAKVGGEKIVTDNILKPTVKHVVNISGWDYEYKDDENDPSTWWGMNSFDAVIEVTNDSLESITSITQLIPGSYIPISGRGSSDGGSLAHTLTSLTIYANGSVSATGPDEEYGGDYTWFASADQVTVEETSSEAGGYTPYADYLTLKAKVDNCYTKSEVESMIAKAIAEALKYNDISVNTVTDKELMVEGTYTSTNKEIILNSATYNAENRELIL